MTVPNHTTGPGSTETKDSLTEEHYRALVQNSSDVLILLGQDGVVRYVSPSAMEVFGRRPDEVIGSTPADLIHPDDIEMVRVRLAPMMYTPGGQLHITFRARHKDGSTVWIEAACKNFADDPSVGSVVCSFRNASDRHEAEEALRESEDLFRSLTQSSPMGIYQRDLKGNCLYVNSRWSEITGLTFEEARGLGWLKVIHSEDKARVITDRAFDSGEFRIVRPDGEVRWLFLRSSPLLDAEGNETGRIGALEDITERVDAQQDSRRLTDIFELTRDIVAIATGKGRLIYLNKYGREFFGISETQELDRETNKKIFSRVPPEILDRMVNVVRPELGETGLWSGEIPIETDDGTHASHLVQLLVHTDEAGDIEYYSCVLHDISERKAFEFQLAHQATHDPLTGLPNRTLLLDRLGVALARARRNERHLAVLFLDLDHFKVVNDSLGHSLGDRLLVEIAKRLGAALRPGDTIARFGGDEFVVLCEELDDRHDAIPLAERLVDSISGPFSIDDSEVFVHVSIGIAFAESAEADPETLIRDADAAMYQAKDRGRARWVIFDHAMRAHAVERLAIENTLRRALERHELKVYYQPIIDLDYGRITGVEALVRWGHPERGLLLPGDFIHIAEETGLIMPIGRWVFDQACRQVQRWRVEYPQLKTLHLSVNLSGHQLAHPEIIRDVGSVLAETGIDPSLVDIEMTESVLMEDVEASHVTLAKLKALGVRLAIDDFGTGYSSLSYLRRFPVDQLKVDRSFVDGLGSDPNDSAIVTAIITLAHTLGLEAVAEGVETAEQLSELRRLSCDKGQGFLMARPATAAEVETMLATDQRW